MRLHVREWGDRRAPPFVCLHGVGATGATFSRLAERLRHRVVAPDLRGHGGSAYEPPWRLETHADDVLETIGDLDAVAWIGHSLGGRLIVEIAQREPRTIRRAILLDPAIRIRPDRALELAEEERTGSPRDHCASAAIALFGELAGPHARVEALRAPTLLVVPAGDSVVGPRQLAYARRHVRDLRVATVPGGHDVLEDAFEETVQAVADFLG